MTEEVEPIAVRFPLSGEWCPVNTPGHSIPSHGTDMLGQRYAYDFFQIDWRKSKGYKFYKSKTFRYLVFGVPLENTYCWSQAILSPFEGEVVEASDGFKERNPVNFFRDIFIASDILPTLNQRLQRGLPNLAIRYCYPSRAFP